MPRRRRFADQLAVAVGVTIIVLLLTIVWELRQADETAADRAAALGALGAIGITLAWGVARYIAAADDDDDDADE